MTDIKKLFDRAYVAARQRSYTKGLLGAPDGTLLSTARPDFVHVRVSQEGRQSVTLAKHLGRVPLRANLPVRMIFENGSFVIEGVDSYYYDSATTGDPPNPFGVTYHTHRSDTALAYEHEAKLLSPGRVFWNAGFSVYVAPLRYYYATWKWWPGGILPLSAHIPPTATKWWWALVGINPATNSAVAVHGIEYATEADLSIDKINAITFTGYIPLVAIKVSNSDTDLSDYTRYYDAAAWHGGNVLLAQLPAIDAGQVIGRATVGTGAAEAIDAVGAGLEIDGGALKRSALTGDVLATLGSNTTTIAAGAVSDGQFRSSAALSAIANPTNGAGSVADVSTTAASNAVLMEQGGALLFDTIATANIDNGAVTNAKLTDMVEARIKGRALGGGTGAPSDLTGTQAAAIAGGVIYIDNVGAGNVGTGEDVLGTYTVPAARLTTRATLWFEAAGSFAANLLSKRIRVKFGATTLSDVTTTVSGGHWFVRGRIVAVGTLAERSTAEYRHTVSGNQFEYTEHTDDLAAANDLVITGEATGDDDIVLRTLVVGWTAPV